MRPALLFLFVFAFSVRLVGQDSIRAKAPEPAKMSFEKACVVTSVIQLKTSKPEAGPGDYIKVKVTNIEELVKEAHVRNQRTVLHFNEIPMRGIYGDFISKGDSSIIFKLTRDTASLASWNIFYQGKTFDHTRIVRVSVGFENDGFTETKVKNFSLVLVRPNFMIFSLVGIAVLLGLFIYLVKKTGILRDDSVEDRHAPYSLARAQLAFWTFVIIISFIYIWMLTGALPPVTGSTLVLLSISMATTAGAKLIDTSKPSGNKLKDDVSDGFFRDIISDQSGVSIHRFQMVVWTILLGIFFIRSVVKELSMPQFDDSMMILMGISSGTYLGLKIPEASAPVASSTAKATTTNENEEEPLDTPAVG